MSDRPDVSGILNAYDAAEEKPRAYLGASLVGSPCDAHLSLHLRGLPNNPLKARSRHIFRDGHKVEASVIDDMREAGLHVIDKDPFTGRQYRWSLYNGIVNMNADGILDVPNQAALVEIKSMNQAAFRQFERKGLRASQPKYFAQVQLMMHASHIHLCVVLAYNKNMSVYHHEWVEFDEFYAHALLARIERVLDGGSQRIAKTQDDWRCKLCEKSEACWNGKRPKTETKKTCANSFPQEDGAWVCSKGCDDVCMHFEPFTVTPL